MFKKDKIDGDDYKFNDSEDGSSSGDEVDFEVFMCKKVLEKWVKFVDFKEVGVGDKKKGMFFSLI